MRVSDLMQTRVRAVRQETPLRDVVRELVQSRLTAVPVLDGKGHPVGVITSSDILEFQAMEDEVHGWHAFQAGEVMTQPVLTVDPDTELHEAALRMVYAEVHRLFVVAGGELVGVVAQTDLVRALAGQRPERPGLPGAGWAG